jgi:hypothetical protein
VVGAATIHNRVASEYAAGDDLPCADVKLLVPLKRSAEFARIRKRVADPHHLDSWQEDGLHFFTFLLYPAEAAEANGADAPVAVFTMHPELAAPLAAVVVAPQANGAEAKVTDLRAPDSAYTVPLSG